MTRQFLPDREARFTELYNQCFGYVYAYILARSAGNAQLAEDIVQETFAAAWLALDRFRLESSRQTWLCAIAGNKLKESYRREIRREKREWPDLDTLAEAPDHLDVEQIALDAETRQRVVQALGHMNPLYRYALVMKYMDAMSVREIGAVIARSAKAADGVLQRARAMFIKEYLRMEGGDGTHEA